MTQVVQDAVAAFEKTLQELQFSGSEPGFGDPALLGRRAALLAVAGAVWARHIGPVLDSSQVRELLGVRTRQAVSDLAKRGRLLALTTREGQRFPAFQFTRTGRPHPALPTILAIFAKASVSPYTIASWFTTPQISLGRETPAGWLAANRESQAVQEAAWRAAARLGE